jgi:hypothetical protein
VAKILDSEITTGFPAWVESVLWVLAENTDIRKFTSPDLPSASFFGKPEKTKLCGENFCSPRNCENKWCKNYPTEHPWLLVVFNNGKQAIAACKTKNPSKNLLQTDLIHHTPHSHRTKCFMLDRDAVLVCSPELLETVYFPALKLSINNRLSDEELPKELCDKERASFVESFIKVISGN